MKGNPTSWRKGKQSPEAKRLELMRRAKTGVESSHGLGGLPKEKGHKPKPITLPKMPWDK